MVKYVANDVSCGSRYNGPESFSYFQILPFLIMFYVFYDAFVLLPESVMSGIRLVGGHDQERSPLKRRGARVVCLRVTKGAQTHVLLHFFQQLMPSVRHLAGVITGDLKRI